MSELALWGAFIALFVFIVGGLELLIYRVEKAERKGDISENLMGQDFLFM